MLVFVDESGDTGLRLSKGSSNYFVVTLVSFQDHDEATRCDRTIDELRKRRDADVERLDPGVRRLMNPHIYHVSLTEKLWHKKQELVASALSPIRSQAAP